MLLHSTIVRRVIVLVELLLSRIEKTSLANSSVVERLLSQGTNILRPKRAGLTSKNFDKFVFMKRNTLVFKIKGNETEEAEEDVVFSLH